MDKAIIINGVEVRAYFRGRGINLRLTKSGVVRLDEPVSILNISRVISSANVSTVRRLIDEVTAGSRAEIEAARAAEMAELAREEAEYQERTGHYAAYRYGDDPACSDTMARVMAAQG